MQVSRDRLKGTLDINQGNYVNAILQRYGFVHSRSVSTPGTGKPLDLKLGTLLDDSNKQLYQEIVVSLICSSTCTRWDIAYSVRQQTRAMSNPTDGHMVAAKRALRYLKGTPNLCVKHSKAFTFHGYSHASHNDDPNNSRSDSGYLRMSCRRTSDVELEETTGGCTLVMRIGVYRTSIREPRRRIFV